MSLKLQTEDPKTYKTKNKIIKYTSIPLLATLLGYVHYSYVSKLFDNDRNFSYLSQLEREMSLRTEMGFYYSYYKTIVEEHPVIKGIGMVVYDRLVEYPNDVNAINRFNIYPEIILGTAYSYIGKDFKTSRRHCYMVDRGLGRSAVESCVGLGEPIFFYLEAIWWLAGFTVSVLFLHATLLSGNILGGCLAVLQYFSNHAECTRVQWAPNERENFAMPFILLQGLLVSLQLRTGPKRTSLFLQVSCFTLNCICLLCWQFTQFIFLTQLAVLFTMEQLRLIDASSLSVFLHSHFCGLHMAILLLQGNDMLKTSLYSSFFISLVGYCFIFKHLKIKIQTKCDILTEIWLILLRISIVFVASLYIKMLLADFLNVQEDTHIWDILYAKFTSYRSFHTMIYTCSEVFNFLPWSSIMNMWNTDLIPFNVLVILNFACCTLSSVNNEIKEERNVKVEEDDSGIDNAEGNKEELSTPKSLDMLEEKADDSTQHEVLDSFVMYLRSMKVDAAVFYNISQMMVYAVMAGLVMRLKLLFTTQMCLLSSMMIKQNYEFFPRFLQGKKFYWIFWVGMMPHLLSKLHKNIVEESSHVGEFSDIKLEELLKWIISERNSRAVFAASMPLSATIMLTTRKAIVCHPHYEHDEARRRAYSVYKMYGKFSPQQLYEDLTHLKANHLVVENKYCYGRSYKGCTFRDIWDLEYPQLKARPHLCHTLLHEEVPHFYPVFQNEEYAVFQIHDLSIRYMPRSFST